MSFQYQEALDLPKVAKDAAAENCLRGLPSYSGLPRDWESQDAKLIDYIVLGEGEATFRDLVRARLDGRGLEDELGLSCHAEEHMVHNLARTLLDTREIER